MTGYVFYVIIVLLEGEIIMFTGIYKITELSTNKVYIGKAKDCLARWKQHAQAFIDYPKYYKNTWHETFAQHPENYTFQILDICPEEELDIKEREYIRQYNSYLDGLNRTKGNYNKDEIKEEYQQLLQQNKEQKQLEKQKYIEQQIRIIAEKYAGLPLIGETQERLLKECRPFLRTAEGEAKFSLNLVLKEMKAQGFEIKQGILGKKHIKNGLPPELLGKRYSYIVPQK